MRRRRRAPEHALVLNIVALTDVAFLIIIFFMFSTHFARTQQSPMDLPQQRGLTAPEAALAQVVLEISKDGQLSLMGGGRLTLEEAVRAAGGAAGSAGGRAPTAELLIRADRNAAAGHVNRLAAALARAGVRNWKLATAGG